MKEFAKEFYHSQAWKRCRDAYAKAAGGLCERCLERGLYNPGEIVHHTVALTPDNIHNPSVALAWDNLELVCRNCHAELHGAAKRYRVDALGRVLL
ncbi:MAG: HNH endonuclease [Oscillospiraceae bacterium]|nr:HNH endonuclease [Oscillospiraceae bacterium]